MAGLTICLRNKFGYCKYNKACQFKHNNNNCEKADCNKQSCEERHPKECWWFRQYNRCKFMYCSYKHTVVPSFSSRSSEIHEKIETLEKQIKEKEIQINLQEKKIKDIESKQNENDLETRMKNVERFVLKLQNKFEKEESESSDYGRYDPQKAGWGVFDPLIRRKSLELKCEQCDYVGRNSTRLKAHIEVLHTYPCTMCQLDEEVYIKFETKDELLRHKSLFHENLDKSLTEDEFKSLSTYESACLRSGPDTPRREDAKKKYNLRLKQKQLKV